MVDQEEIQEQEDEMTNDIYTKYNITRGKYYEHDEKRYYQEKEKFRFKKEEYDLRILAREPVEKYLVDPSFPQAIDLADVSLNPYETRLFNVKSAIHNLASREESNSLPDIPPGFTPYVLRMIMMKSKKIIAYDREGDLLPYLTEAMDLYKDNEREVTIYGRNDTKLNTKKDGLVFFELNKNETVFYKNDSVRNAIIGDDNRYRIEWNNTVPANTSWQIKRIFALLLNRPEPRSPTENFRHSITNFFDKDEAQNIIAAFQSTFIVNQPK